ncbi:MAG: outer membrane beta-barrel protein [Prevotella sp.]|nr:outer membrane beta-barrel protein [Prevotella sp.]
MVRKIILPMLLAVVATATQAQTEPEYRLEIGAGGGAVSYLGDYNAALFGEMQPMGAVMAKYKSNPRMAVALTIGYGKLQGSSAKANTWYPEDERYKFSKSLIDVNLRFEYNFWAYGTGKEYRGARKLAPFITMGLGSAIHGDPEKGFAVSLPIGAGVKYKIADRVNLTAEWRVHFALSDLLDGKEDPYGIKSSGLFKNTDGYSVLQLAATYELWAKCRTCHNDRD